MPAAAHTAKYNYVKLSYGRNVKNEMNTRIDWFDFIDETTKTLH